MAMSPPHAAPPAPPAPVIQARHLMQSPTLGKGFQTIERHVDEGLENETEETLSLRIKAELVVLCQERGEDMNIVPVMHPLFERSFRFGVLINDIHPVTGGFFLVSSNRYPHRRREADLDQSLARMGKMQVAKKRKSEKANTQQHKYSLLNDVFSLYPFV